MRILAPIRLVARYAITDEKAFLEKDNSPLDLNILRKQALSLLNAAKYGHLSKNG